MNLEKMTLIEIENKYKILAKTFTKAVEMYDNLENDRVHNGIIYDRDFLLAFENQIEKMHKDLNELFDYMENLAGEALQTQKFEIQRSRKMDKNHRLKIIGKVTNIEQEKRLAYLEGMIDIMDIIGADNFAEREFACEMYNYLAKYGTDHNTIYRFCNPNMNDGGKI